MITGILPALLSVEVKARGAKCALKKLNPAGNSQAYADVNEAWEHALEQAGDDDRIVVFGSFHTVGVILERLYSKHMTSSRFILFSTILFLKSSINIPLIKS